MESTMVLEKEIINKRQHLLWTFGCLSFCCIIVALLKFPSIDYPGYDSSFYINCAQRFIDTGRFEHIAIKVSSMLDKKYYEPIALWPSGYPLLIAVFSKITHLNCFYSVFVINILSIVGSLFVLCLLFYNYLPFQWARVGITLWCTANLNLPFLFLSDYIYLFITLWSIYTLDKSQFKQKKLLFVSGILAGFAWTVRNVGITFIIASFFTLLYANYYKVIKNNGNKTVPIFVWGSGCFIGVVWYLIRNIMVFGRISSYTLPKSIVPFYQNCFCWFRSMFYSIFDPIFRDLV